MIIKNARHFEFDIKFVINPEMLYVITMNVARGCWTQRCIDGKTKKFNRLTGVGQKKALQHSVLEINRREQANILV
jgi:hypothetical protein